MAKMVSVLDAFSTNATLTRTDAPPGSMPSVPIVTDKLTYQPIPLQYKPTRDINNYISPLRLDGFSVDGRNLCDFMKTVDFRTRVENYFNVNMATVTNTNTAEYAYASKMLTLMNNAWNDQPATKFTCLKIVLTDAAWGAYLAPLAVFKSKMGTINKDEGETKLSSGDVIHLIFTVVNAKTTFQTDFYLSYSE